MIRKDKKEEQRKEEERALQRRGGFHAPRAWMAEMDRWFDEFRRDFETHFWRPGWWSGPLTDTRLRQPLVDLIDEGSSFVVKAELPGISKEDLDITVTEDGIEMRAETHQEAEQQEEDYFFRERSYRTFHRSLALPAEVLADQAEATLKDGVLEVRLPKKEPAPKARPVKVRVT
jgi:HSP20 family protein